jgi:short-subunit dehydrogenase
MLQGLRLDLHRTGVKVTMICPGYVDTPLITDQERTSLRHVLTAPDAARRICRAIEAGRSEYWFPWQTWLPAWLASLLPFPVYRRLASLLPEMEETHSESAHQRAVTPNESRLDGLNGQPQTDDAD